MKPFRGRRKKRDRRPRTASEAPPPSPQSSPSRHQSARAEARAALTGGVRATARRGRAAQPALARTGRGATGLLRRLAAGVFRFAALVERRLKAGSGTLSATSTAAATRLSAAITPQRAIFVVTLAAAGCLLASQFVDYRGVEVGEPGYAEVTSIAPPPQRFQETPNEAHAYLLVPVALAAAALATLALLRRRWRLGRLVALTGILAIAVALIVDLPQGLDEGKAAVVFAGANATLNEGFYAELAAAAALVGCGLLLAASLRPARRTEGRQTRRGGVRPRLRKAPSLARSGP
jgi:hypothetical protein